MLLQRLIIPAECSKRWNHSLDPNLDHSAWTPEEVCETPPYPANSPSGTSPANFATTERSAFNCSQSTWKPLERHPSHSLLRKIDEQHQKPVSQVTPFGCRRVTVGLKLSIRYTILSRKGFQAPPNSTSCCEKRAKRRAVDPDDYDQGHMTEESVEPSDLIQMDTGEATAHTPNFNHTFDSTGLFDGTGYNSFLDGFQMHDNTFAAEKQTFQSPPTSQINDFHFPASAGDFAELQPFHEFPAKNSSGSDQTTHVNPVASSRHSGGVSYIPQQRSNAARNPLPESPANEVLSTLKSASSDRATVCLDDDMSDSDEATAEPPVQSDQPRSRQKRRITITLEHADPKTLASFLNAALQSKAKISFETNDFGR